MKKGEEIDIYFICYSINNNNYYYYWYYSQQSINEEREDNFRFEISQKKIELNHPHNFLIIFEKLIEFKNYIGSNIIR